MELRRILYVSHRYHTNQVPIMKGWDGQGVQVLFMAQYEGVSEVHDYVIFHHMRPSLYTRIYSKYADWRYDASLAESKKIIAFIPSFADVYRTVKEFAPQIVVLRNMSIGNALICIVCKLLGIQYLISYTQTPLYREKADRRPFSWLAKKIFPNVSFTPVWHKGEYRGVNIPKEWYAPHYFIPLVCEPYEGIKRTYCKHGIIHLLDIGKYRNYKNHFFLIDAFSQVADKEKFRLTIIGQLENSAEKDYYARLVEYIREKGLEKYVEVKGNVPFYEIKTIYSQADVLILPSKSETAGMVILEAMSQGLCVLSSNNCGLASYLEKSDCGRLFTIKDTGQQLTALLDEIAENESVISRLGEKSIEAVRKNYGFEKYLESLGFLMQDYYHTTLALPSQSPIVPKQDNHQNVMTDNWKTYYKADAQRYGRSGGSGILRFQKILRKAHFTSNRFLSLYYRWRLKRYRDRFGLELKPESSIGKGLYLGHPYNITINKEAVIGQNCNIHKGVVIGRENRGKRKGVPVIGNRVWIGINAAIVGKITIGDDVMIAPNSYVNCDVPSHSVVYGNPCIIKQRENATEGYVNNTYEE